jgi:hypothetical protein
MTARWPAIAAALALLVAGDALAAPPTPSATPGPAPPSRVSLDVSPVFGADAAAGDGWVEVIARVDNAGPTPAKGTLKLGAERPGYYYGPSTEAHFAARATYQAPPHGSVVVHLPMRVGRSLTTVSVTANTDDGTKVAETTVSFSTAVAPLLVDVDQPSRLAAVMRGWPMAPTWAPSGAYTPTSSTPLTVGVPAVDPTTGDPVLPEHAAAYSPVTVVVLPSDRLAHLQGAQLEALVGWVLSGGTIAVFPTRPEDLRAGVLTTLVGGTISTTAPPGLMMTLPSVTRGSVPPSMGMPPGTPPPTWMPSPTETEDSGATPIGFFVPVRTTPLPRSAGVGPSAALRPRLAGFVGGNLHPSAFGATAPYGLGQVHVLGFDPTTSPAIEDGWTHARLLDMLADAWDRRSLVAFPQGAGNDRASSPFEVHRAMDPNENFRPALGIAALLLVIYSVVAGPLTFLRARRRARPLDPLVWAPVASGVCFAAVVLVGLAGKGWSGRARHLALVEAGAGMSRGTEHLFRGFFASQTRAMRVRASEPTSVLDIMSTDSRDQGEPVLSLEKDGASLENMTSLPWQTVVVSEDAFADLGGGVSVHQKPDGSVVVTNHTGKRLANVVIWAPQTDASWFASIDDGVTVVSSGGRTLFAPAARVPGTAGLRTVHQLDTAHVRTVLGSSVAADMVAAWSALSAGAGNSVDWWPDDVPVVLGEVVGGAGIKGDSGLRVESDRLMFRVVGEGGAS